ncbi:hypothetical protein [Sphingobium cloacae]|uniref:hypothetical protein n=1 Tax=Sphingobium cloacae TaxID=120107 RepID=UPI000A86BAC2|nr:hypothetical protein [Sphingobium cloacae]
MRDGLRARMAALAEARAAKLRAAVVEAMGAAGVASARVDGDSVRASGRGLLARWIDDLALREAGRGRA